MRSSLARPRVPSLPDPGQQQWRATLARKLTTGHTQAHLRHVKALLAASPPGWQHFPDPLSRPAGLPMGASAYANRAAPAPWVGQAVAALVGQGAFIHSAVPDRAQAGVPPEPPYLAMAPHASELNVQAYADHLAAQPWLAPAAPNRLALALHWLTQVFVLDGEWGNDPTPPQALAWAWLKAAPEFKSGEPAARVWAHALGMLSPLTPAPRTLRALALGGLDGNVVIPWELLPPACQQDFPRLGLGPWRTAPAWAWALLTGVFRGRMLLNEVRLRQPGSWDPNLVLPGTHGSVGQWVLRRTLSGGPTRATAMACIADLQTLGLNWTSGTPGHTPLDLIDRAGGAALFADVQQWEKLRALQRAHRMEEGWGPAAPTDPSHPPRPRL